MMAACPEHRDYLAALADGETEVVPRETMAHVGTCDACSREVEAHRALSVRLKQVPDLPSVVPPATARRSRWRLAGGAAAVAVALAAVGGWLVLSRPDPVSAAVSAASEPMQIQSNDPAAVGAWCRRESGQPLPEVELDGMTVVGARMDSVSATDIVTLHYSAPAGGEVTVGWLEGQTPSGSGVSEATASGHQVLVVHSPRGVAVIGGSSGSLMWEAAAAIESP